MLGRRSVCCDREGETGEKVEPVGLWMATRDRLWAVAMTSRGGDSGFM